MLFAPVIHAPATAAPVRILVEPLSPVGEHVSGSFVYDHSAMTFGTIDLSVTGNGLYDGLYDTLVRGNAFSLVASSTAYGNGVGAPLLVLGLGAAPSWPVAGDITTLDNSGSGLGLCQSGCGTTSAVLILDSSYEGTVTGEAVQPVPVPAAGLLLLAGIGAGAVMRRCG